MSVEPPEPKRILRCASFHSVKGGVGKSTLSYLVARLLAEQAPEGERVALIDADLTGTSLADVLSLRAPRWNGVGRDDQLPLDREPTEWTELEHSSGAEGLDPPPPPNLTTRALRENGHAHDVPLLNDFLLWKNNRYDPDKDVHPEALFWKPLAHDPLAERLVVIPSSALPNDLAQILPLIYDELHAAYVESRLEWLLHWLLVKTNVKTVIFDTPPTIPGLSRAVLSMAMRLPDDVSLADDGGTPQALTRAAGTTITWTAFLIASTDLQDMRAADRWLDGREPAELSRIQAIINRAERNDPEELLKAKLTGVPLDVPGGTPSGYGGHLLESPMIVQQSNELNVGSPGPLSKSATEELARLVEQIRK